MLIMSHSPPPQELGMSGKAALPHYGNPEDIEKIVSYLEGKPGGASEGDLLRNLGTRYADPRKFPLYDRLNLFTRDDGVFRLTPAGQCFVSGGEERRRRVVRGAIRAFAPYHEMLAWAASEGVDVLEADRVRHVWTNRFGDSIDLDNAYRASAAPATFFCVCEMAGLGNYIAGRRGGRTRLEIDVDEL